MQGLSQFLFLLLIPFSSIAQSLSGTITDAKTGEAIDAATIFIPRTTHGTLSKADGSYELKLQEGLTTSASSELIISHLGYRTRKIKITLKAGENRTRNFELYPDAKDLQTITVTAKQSKKWRKQLKQFQKKFLGSSKNAGQCTIVNPTVLQFEDKDGKLIAKANDILEIENRALGYSLFFLLEHFETEGQSVSYAGKPFFKSLSSSTDKELKTWKRKRRLAYEGSLSHFLRALAKDQLRQEGFDLQTAALKNNQKFVSTGSTNPGRLLSDGPTSAEKLLSFQGFLKITYTREEDINSREATRLGRAAASLGHPAERDMIAQDNSMKRNKSSDQVSYLFARKDRIPIDTSGFLKRPELLVEYGYWNTEGAADMVPLDFNMDSPSYTADQTPDEVLAATSKHPPLNDFEFTSLRIPYDEIHAGGPPRDGIPSIDQPKFVDTKTAANFLSPKDEVLGLLIKGKAKAYPIKILNYHEVVNDVLGDRAIVVTYCPLCGSGAVFRRQFGEQKYTFGVSGLLYNSDVLLYDRQTESLWSQVMGEAISGPLSGQQLELLPISHTTFDAWQQQYPDSEILSTDTGHKRNYQRSPYQDYPRSDRLAFPVAKRSDLLPTKSKVVGIEVDGSFKAYPLKQLRKAKSSIEDQVNGKKLFVEYDKAANAAIIKDETGTMIPTITLYWFAWYAFHPDTEVFTN